MSGDDVLERVRDAMKGVDLHYATVRELWPEVGHPVKGWEKRVPVDVAVATLVAEFRRCRENCDRFRRRAEIAEQHYRRLREVAARVLAEVPDVEELALGVLDAEEQAYAEPLPFDAPVSGSSESVAAGGGG